MAYTTNITIDKLEVNKSDDSVYNILYTLSLTENDVTKSKKCDQRHLAVNEDSFTPLDELTEAQVVSWINLKEQDVEILRAAVAEEISNSTYIINPPWL